MNIVKLDYAKLDRLDELEARREKYNKWVEMRNYMGISRHDMFVFVKFRCAPDTFHVHVKTGNAIVLETGEHLHMSDMYNYDCYSYVENKCGFDMDSIMDEWHKTKLV